MGCDDNPEATVFFEQGTVVNGAKPERRVGLREHESWRSLHKILQKSMGNCDFHNICEKVIYSLF